MLMCRWTTLVLFALLSNFSFYSRSQESLANSVSITKFNRLDVKDGLPHRTIWDLEQDSDGFLWLGTSQGLVRFDGFEFIQFRNKHETSKSYDANIIRTVKTVGHELWYGSESGLGLYDPKIQTLAEIKLFVDKSQQLKDFKIFDIHYANKTAWLATSTGLFGVDAKNKNIIFNSNTLRNKNEFNAKTNTVLSLGKERLVVGTDHGIYRLNTATKAIKWLSLPKAFSALKIKRIFKRTNGQIILATNSGIFEAHLLKNTVKRLNPSLRAIEFEDIAEDKKGTLWMASRRQGLYSVNSLGKIQAFKYSNNDTHSISDNKVYSILFDRSDVLWAGTFNAGLNQLNSNAQKINLITDSPKSLSCLPSPVIYSIFQEDLNNIWLGTQDGLVNLINKQKECILYTRTSDANRISGNQILNIKKTNYFDEQLFFTTNSGLNAIDLKSRKVKYKNDIVALPYIEDFIFTESKLYLGNNSGVYFQNNFHTEATLIKSEKNIPSRYTAFKFEQSKKGLIFVASSIGLLSIGNDDTVRKITWGSFPLRDYQIKCIFIDSRDTLWVGIDQNGLYQFSLDGRLINSYTDQSVLHAIREFTAITEDKDHDIWISSTNGLSKLERGTQRITNFHVNDGLPSESYTRGASFVSENKLVYFGNRKGLTIIEPNKIDEDKVAPTVKLTKFLYFNEPILKTAKKRNFSLPKEISRLENLVLNYNDQVFGFEFAGLHFADPSRNNYAFMMEGWDNGWSYVSADSRKITYSNLPAGKYTFKVNASNSQGVWTSKPFSLPITIHPPWWLTTWAYFIYAALIILSIYSFIAYRTRALEKRAKILASNVEKRTQELATEKNKVEKLLSQKNEEFANVSHEFRTPLTLILGPIAQLLKQDKSALEKQKLNIVQRNGYRLLRMVDQLLNLETFRVKSITQRTPQPIGNTIKMLVEAFKDLAEEKEITVSIVQIDPINFEFTPDAIEKIVLNVISNAVKYTLKRGTISVSALREANNQYCIRVSDTGIGIPKEKLNSVFDRYARVLDENSEKITGAGIGLSLVKSLVDSHGGTIDLTSQYGEGTSIVIKLPIINEVENLSNQQHANAELVAMELMSIQAQSISEFDAQTTIEDQSNQQSILVIEDNPDMRHYIAQSLSEEFQILLAENGEEGLEIAKEQVPDLIVSDVMMPKMDGYQTTNELRQNEITSHIPVILLTARGDRESRLRGWYEKADEYITKPFDVDELRIRVRNLLEIRDILKKRFGETVFDLQTNTQSNIPNAPPELNVINEEELELNQANLQKSFIQKLNSILEASYQETEFGIDELASQAAMSQRQLFRKLRSVLDMTPSEYIRRFRLEKSKLLLTKGKSAQFTAFEVGFSSLSYFSRCFKAQYGISPSQFVQAAAIKT